MTVFASLSHDSHSIFELEPCVIDMLKLKVKPFVGFPAKYVEAVLMSTLVTPGSFQRTRCVTQVSESEILSSVFLFKVSDRDNVSKGIVIILVFYQIHASTQASHL